MARNLVSIFAHAVFGLVFGLAYHAIAKPDPVVETTAVEFR